MPKIKESIACNFCNTNSMTNNALQLKILTATLRKKFAKDVQFTDDFIVNNAIGDFVAGESLKDLSLAEILTKLLRLTKTDVVPESPPDLPPVQDDQTLPGVIITEKAPIYQMNSELELEEVSFTYKTFTDATYNAEPVAGDTAFYQKLDTSGNIVESGYQHCTEMQDMYYLVMLPEELVVGKNVKIQTWSALEGCWKDLNSPLTCDYEEITAAFNEVGLEAPATVSGYNLWADLSSTDPGTNYRYIIL